MENEYTKEVIGVVRTIGENFIRGIRGTPVHEVKAKLGKSRGVLDLLTKGRVLQVAAEEWYYPCFLALQFLDVETRSYARQCTTVVLQTLKDLYKTKGPKEFPYHEVLQAATRGLGGAVDNKMVHVGALMAADFTSYVAGWSISENGGVNSVTVREGIIDFDSLDEAWSEEEIKRNSQAAQLGFVERSHPVAPEVVSPPQSGSPMRGEEWAIARIGNKYVGLEEGGRVRFFWFEVPRGSLSGRIV